MQTSLIFWMLSAFVGVGEIHVDGTQFKDAQGRAVLLRGVNVGARAKAPPFLIMAPGDLDPLPSWGVNVVRLLFNWEAYEPAFGRYNAAYLRHYKSAVEAAADLGLYVIIDFHQDSMGRTLLGGCGEGFPDWAVSSEVHRATPDNGRKCANWYMSAYFDEDLHQAWKEFFRDQNQARTHFIEMVHKVATAFADAPGVIGYDLLNEPWGDEKTELYRLYADEAQSIRSVSPQAILFIEPNVMVAGGLQSDMSRPPFDNIVYAPHFYDNWVVSTHTYLGNNLAWAFNHMRTKAAQWGVPLFLGEYGAGATVSNVVGYLQTLRERMDEAFTSGAQWCYTPTWSPSLKDGWNDEDLSIVDGYGAWRANYKPRPYPQRIAGVPLALRATDEMALKNNVFELRWHHDPKLGTTEIYLPKDVFFGATQLDVQTTGRDVSCMSYAEHVVCASPIEQDITVRVLAGAPDDTPPTMPVAAVAGARPG